MLQFSPQINNKNKNFLLHMDEQQIYKPLQFNSMGIFVLQNIMLPTKESFLTK